MGQDGRTLSGSLALHELITPCTSHSVVFAVCSLFPSFLSLTTDANGVQMPANRGLHSQHLSRHTHSLQAIHQSASIRSCLSSFTLGMLAVHSSKTHVSATRRQLLQSNSTFAVTLAHFFAAMRPLFFPLRVRVDLPLTTLSSRSPLPPLPAATVCFAKGIRQAL